MYEININKYIGLNMKEALAPTKNHMRKHSKQENIYFKR